MSTTTIAPPPGRAGAAGLSEAECREVQNEAFGLMLRDRAISVGHQSHEMRGARILIHCGPGPAHAFERRRGLYYLFGGDRRVVAVSESFGRVLAAVRLLG